MKKNTKKLFRVNMTAVKHFYVEAQNQSEALNHAAFQEEFTHGGEKLDWEPVEGEANEVPEGEAASVRLRHASNILD